MAKPSFGATLSKLRQSKGMSLRKTAAAANISPTYLAQLERDQSTPSEKVVFELAEALGTDPDDLLAVTGRIAEDVLDVIRKHPKAFATLLLELQDASEAEITTFTQKLGKRKPK